MKHARLGVVISVVGALAMAATAQAGNLRTWVANAGSDTSTCGSPASPCKTLQQAVNLTAAGGEVDVLDPIQDFGATVSKAITIDGGNFTHIQVSGTGVAGFYVNAGPNDVVAIRNLSINVLPAYPNDYAITWYSGGTLEIENVSISGGAGISGSPSATGQITHFFAKDVIVRDATTGGVELNGGGVSLPINAVLDGVTVINPLVGVTIAYGQALATHCSVVHASAWAFEAGPYSFFQVEDSTAAFSTYGMASVGTGANLWIAGNNIENNSTGLYPLNNGQLLSFGTNRLAGNDSDGVLSGTVTLK